MKHPLLISVFSLSILVLNACTTINRGTKDFLFLDTVPQGAKVTLTKISDNEQIDCPETPCALRVPRRSKFIVKFDHDDFEPFEVLVTSQSKRTALLGSVSGNTILGGGAVIGVGATTGALTGAFTLGAGTGGAVGLGATAAVPPAAAVAGSMVLFDLASGARLNLAPNPIVVKLSPVGTKNTFVDPRIVLIREIEQVKVDRKAACSGYQNRTREETNRCRDASVRLRTLQKEFDAALGTLIEEPQSTPSADEVVEEAPIGNR